jgi:hypothetical protein
MANEYQVIPILFFDSKFRHYRVRIDKNNFLKIKAKIYSPEQLKKILDSIPNITGVYQTISTWLNPQYLSRKKVERSSKINDRIKDLESNFFMYCNYLMDFDRKDYKTEEEMLYNLNLAKEFLVKQSMEKFVLQKTPHGGRQLIALDFPEWANIKVAYPKDREYAYGMKLKKLTEMLLTGKEKPTKEEVKKAKVNPYISWDYNVSLNTRSLFRTPNTLGDNGVRVKLIYHEGSMIFPS